MENRKDVEGMRESAYFKTLTFEKLREGFERGIRGTNLRDMGLELSEIREASRGFGCHSPLIMMTMEKWFHAQIDILLKTEQNWIEYVRENALFDEEAKQNLHFVEMEARCKTDEQKMQFNSRMEQLEVAKKRFVDTELRLIIFRKREEKEAFEEYITQMEDFYHNKLKIWLYERLSVMLANIHSIMGI